MIDGRKEALKYGSMRHSKFHEIAKKYIEGYESGRTWSRKIKSPLTKRKYQIALYKYCDEIGKNPDELIRFKVEGMAYGVSGDPEKMMKMRQAEKLLEDTLAKTKKGQLMIKHAVISFYRKNGFPLMSNVAEEWVQREKSPEEYREEIPKNADEIQRIAENLDSVRDVAALWFVESTFVRRGTLPLLTWGDLQECRWVTEPDGTKELRFFRFFDKNKEGELDELAPLMIDIGPQKLKGKYRGVRQVTFVHFYAYQKLVEYKRHFEHKTKRIWDSSGHAKKSFKPKIKPDTQLFIAERWMTGKIKPISPEVFYTHMTEACVLAWGNGQVYTPHSLKRFGKTVLVFQAGINKPMADLMTAHKPTKRDKAYIIVRHDDLVKLHEAYKKTVTFLVPREVQIQAERKRTEDLIQKTQVGPMVVLGMDRTMKKLQNRIERLEKQLKEHNEA